MLEKLKSNFKKYFSKGPKGIFVVVLILIIGITMTIHSMKKTLDVFIDSKESKIVTYRSNLKDALEQNDIVLGPKDKVTPSLNTKVKDGQKIHIQTAVEVEVEVDSKKFKIKSAEENVDKMLKSEGIAIGSADKILPGTSDKLKSGMKVVITRVDTKEVKENKPIEYSVVVQNDDSLTSDEKKVTQEGQPGNKEITTKITYENGKEVARQIIKEIVTKEPIKQLVTIGTLSVFSPTRGERIIYKAKISARATAYTEDYRFGITASGTKTVRNENGYSSIAVDPRVIPLGTKLYVPGYGYGMALDTGGAIKGNRVDLFFDSESECYDWGARMVDVYIVK